MSGDTSSAAYSGGGMRQGFGGPPPQVPDDQQNGKPGYGRQSPIPGSAPPPLNPASLVAIPPAGGPGGPGPGGPDWSQMSQRVTSGDAALPGGGAAPAAGGFTPDPRFPGRFQAPQATQGEPWSERDGQGNPSGYGMIDGKRVKRAGAWWIDAQLAERYGDDDDRAQVGRYEYSDGVNKMAQARQAAATAAKTTATGYNSEAERRRRADASASIGVDFKSDENQDDPVFVARQVLAEELFNGGKYLLPGYPLAFSYNGGAGQGDAGYHFKDTRTGAEVQPTPEQLALAKSIGDGGGGGGAGAQSANAVNVNGLPLAPGANAYGLPGANVGWQTQAGQQSNYPYLARGAVAMPGSKDGVHVIMAEAGVPEVAVPVPKLRAVAGDDVANRVIQSVSHTVVRPDGQTSAAKGADGVPKLAAGALTEGREGGGAAFPNSVPGAGGDPGALPGGPSSFNPNTVYSNPFGNGGSYTPFAGYTPASYSPYQQRQMTDEEKAQLSAITGIAHTLTGQGGNLYSIGAPAYAQAMKYYQTLLGGNRTAMQAATAGSAEAIRAQGRGLEGRITAQLGRSGAADAAKAQSAQQEAAAIAHLTQGVQPAAAAALQGAGLEGAQAGAGMETQAGGLHQGVQQALTQSRQFEENLGEQSRQFGASFGEQSRQFGTQLTEQSRQYAAGLAEQVRQGNMSYQQAMAGLALNDSQFQSSFAFQNKQFEEMVRQFNENLKLQGQQIGAQKSGAKGSAIAGGIGTAAMIVIAI